MTAETETLTAGRELDAQVAEKVFGYHGCGYYGPTKPSGMHEDYERFDTPAEALVKYREHWPHDDDMDVSDVHLCHWKDGWGPLFVDHYSTDIASAWTVVEKMVELLVMARWEFRAASHGTYDAELWVMEEDGSWTCLAEEDDIETMPLAICRAALVAVADLSSAPPRTSP